MKLIYGLIIVVFLGWCGNYVYNNYPFNNITNTSPSSASHYNKSGKCVSADGSTYYGEIPPEVICTKFEPISILIQTEKNPSKVNTSNSNRNLRFKCDGRQYCSQMTSCAEAKFFEKNCPSTKMNGDGDNTPCEQQWCK